jgi:superfamily II helicase
MVKTVKKKYAIDEKVEKMCSSCDVESIHTVLTVTKQGQFTKLICDVCQTVNTFKSGVKTSVGMNANGDKHQNLARIAWFRWQNIDYRIFKRFSCKLFP